MSPTLIFEFIGILTQMEVYPFTEHHPSESKLLLHFMKRSLAWMALFPSE